MEVNMKEAQTMGVGMLEVEHVEHKHVEENTWLEELKCLKKLDHLKCDCLEDVERQKELEYLECERLEEIKMQKRSKGRRSWIVWNVNNWRNLAISNVNTWNTIV
jgi:hypothetical protein